MRPRYETEHDLAAEACIIEKLSEALGFTATKVPTSYGVDFMLAGDDGSLACWAEVKHRRGMIWGQYPDVMLSVLKLRAAAGLRAATGADTLFAVADSTGEVRVASLRAAKPQWIRHGGRTTQTRDPADVEPVVHIPIDDFMPIEAGGQPMRFLLAMDRLRDDKSE